MTISLNVNKSLDLRKELIDIKKKSNSDYALKILITLALTVAGVASILFLSAQFFPVGIGLIVLSSFILYHLIQQCRHTNKIFHQTLSAMPALK